MTHVIDTNVLVAFFRLEEEHHREAERLLMQMDRIVLLEGVLQEFLTVLAIREDKKTARKALSALIQDDRVELLRLHDDQLYEALRYYEKDSSALSFVDISLLLFARSNGAQVCTFDERLKKEAGRG